MFKIFVINSDLPSYIYESLFLSFLYSFIQPPSPFHWNILYILTSVWLQYTWIHIYIHYIYICIHIYKTTIHIWERIYNICLSGCDVYLIQNNYFQPLIFMWNFYRFLNSWNKIPYFHHPLSVNGHLDILHFRDIVNQVKWPWNSKYLWCRIQGHLNLFQKRKSH